MKHICSIFSHIKHTSTKFDRDVLFLLDRIRTGKSRNQVELVRLEKDPLIKKKLKEELPPILFSGTFRHRSTLGLENHSGLICLDFDKFPNEKKLNEWREKLIKDKYTFSCFLSPSGDGLKLLVKIPPEKENHRLFFDALEKHYDSDFFDKGVFDICRACFESYDPKIYVNENSVIWDKKKIQEKNLGTAHPAIPVKSENRIIENLLSWFNKNFTMVEGERSNNLLKLAKSFNDFGVSKIEAENVLKKYACKGFDENEIEKILNSGYKNKNVFGTKFFEDKLVKEKIEKNIREGKSIKEIKKEIPTFEEKEIEEILNVLKDDLKTIDFWSYNKNGGVVLSHHKFKYFLEERQFFKFYPEGISNNTSNFVLVKIEENLLDDTNASFLKDFVLNNLKQRTDIGYAPFDFMASSTKYFKEDYLSMLETASINLKEDTADDCYIYFKNCCVKITKDKIKEIDYVDLDGFVWKKQIIKRSFKKSEFKDCVFEKFLFLISGKSVERFNSMRSIIGYLLHSYKTSANNKAIILNDETISENPNGGSGKGLFWNALSHMKKLNSIDGKQFDFNKTFAYQTVSPDTQLLVFDDVKKNFAFENLFSLITEGITLEKKNKDAIKIPVSKSPKIIITTNYTVGGIGGSHDRRKFEVELSAHFNKNHTPLNEFGHMLFHDWNNFEWSKFDNFMINCVQYYLSNGLVKSEYQNLEVRKFIKETSFEFYEWVHDDSLPLNFRIIKTQKYNEFVNEYSDLKKWLTQKKFSQWIDSFCKFKGYNSLGGKSLDGRWIQIVNDIKEEVSMNDEQEVFL